MQNLFLDEKIGRDPKELKNKKRLNLLARLFFRILKNNPFVSFVGFLLPIVVAAVNFSFNQIVNRQFRTFQGEEITSSTPRFNLIINYIFWSYTSNKQYPILEFIVKIILGFIAAKSILSICHIYLNTYISWKVDNDLKKDFFEHFVDSRYENSSRISPKVFTQFSSNIEGISEQIWTIPNRFVYVIVSIILNCCYDLERISWKVGLIISFTFLIAFTAIFLLLKKTTNEHIKIRRRNEEGVKFIFERIRNLSHIKLSSSEKLEKAKLESKLDKIFLENRRTINLIVLTQGISSYFFVPSIPFLLCSISAFYSPTSKLSEILSQFITYRSLCSEFEKMINSFIRIDSLISEFSMVAESIAELDMKSELVKKNIKEFSFDKDIVFEKTSFSYPLRPDVKVIEDLDFRFINGKKYGIVGKNGVGKSTITKLILKLFDPLSGRILISGNDIRNLETRSLHQQICRLTNSPSFFNMSILENVFYPYNFSQDDPNQKETNIEILWEAAKKTKIDKFISSLPYGFDTVIKESGSDLSEGQKQQIEAMKVFIRPYKIYVFDEILSNVHPLTREVILENIFEEVKGKTVLVIDHHYDIFNYMDEIYNFSRSELKKVGLDNINNITNSSEDFDDE